MMNVRNVLGKATKIFNRDIWLLTGIQTGFEAHDLNRCQCPCS